MKREPLRTLVITYGLAAIAGVAAMAAGAGPWASLLGFWIGGAMMALAVAAATFALRGPEDTLSGEGAPVDAGEWEDDRARDQAHPDRTSRFKA